MKKRDIRRRLLLSSLLILSALRTDLAYASLRFENIPASTLERWAPLAETQWKTWSNKYASSAKLEEISVQAVERVDGQSGRRLKARSSFNGIEIDSLTSSNESDTVFLHELAHVFLLKSCSRVFPSSLESELFALWMSRDFRRFQTRASRFNYAVDARKFVSERSVDKAAFFEDDDSVAALSRLLIEAERSASTTTAIDDALRSRLQTCRWDRKGALDLISAPLLDYKTDDLAFVLLDGITGEVIGKEGDVESVKPVGSILKPALLLSSKTFKVSKTSAHAPEWNCPKASPLRLWGWEEALAKSCNGFFLDTKAWPSQEQEAYSRLLKKHDFILPSKLGIGIAIGIYDEIQSSALKVAMLYTQIVFEAPEIWRAMMRTPVDGTLSALPDSRFFSKNQIALKSGTTRDAEGRPREGWIVAIGPKVDEEASYIAVIRQTGSSPAMLLARLKERLVRVPRSSKAKVRILGLVPPTALEFGCGSEKFVNAQEMPIEGKIHCAGSPLIARFPDSSGEMKTRQYFGSLVKEKLQPDQRDSSVNVSSKQALARRASAFVLTTSERHYLVGSLASEHASGREETLKALALVIKNNLHSGRHSKNTVCDTTHCQSFGIGLDTITPSLRLYLSKIVDSVADQKIVSAEPWLNFSKGGSMSWTRELEADLVNRKLKLPLAAFSMQIEDKKVAIKTGVEGGGPTRTIPCEKLRSALKLLNCPEQVNLLESGKFEFIGRGEGHGLGLDLERADLMATEGRSYEEILKAFFKNARVVSK